MGETIRVRVNDEFILDAGTHEQVSGTGGEVAELVHPPATSLFHQVLAYLRAKPDVPDSSPSRARGREGAAAAALVLRWGSYLAVLLDGDKPLWKMAGSAGTSRIADAEMARINIEASAALGEWIDIYRADRGEGLYKVMAR